MSKFSMSVQLEKHLCAALRSYGSELVSELALKYGFDAGEALRGLEIDVVPTTKKKEGKAATRLTPGIPLPYCGVVKEDWCNGIRLNHGLYTQCTQVPGENGLCKTCTNQTLKSDTGKPTYGVIQDRYNTTNPQMEFRDPKGKLVTSYGKVMAKLNITRGEAEAEAEKFGFTIAEEQFEVKVTKRGRPKKATAASDTESEGEPEQPKKRGRPKKVKKVVSTNAGDDLIASLLAQAKAHHSETDDEENIMTVPAATKTKKKRRPSKGKLALPPTSVEAPIVDKSGFNVEEAASKFFKVEAQQDDEEVSVVKFEFEGRTYLRASDSVLYDEETHEPVGAWNDAAGRIDAYDNDEDFE